MTAVSEPRVDARPARPAANPGPLAAVVAAHLEPITRFGAADLSAQGPEQPLEVPLTLELEQRVSFGATRHKGVGALPSGVLALNSHEAVETELARQRRSAESDCAGAVAAWVRGEPGAYRRLLPGTAAFGTAPRSCGVQHACGSCSGQWQVQCSDCAGKGRKDCTACFASGRRQCESCVGTRKLRCDGCAGRGRWTEWVMQTQWDSVRKEHVTVSAEVQKHCGRCGASGQMDCGRCDYAGKVVCAWCGGAGHQRCHVCNASGKVDCQTCAASGTLHLWARIEAEVTRVEKIVVHSDDTALVALARDRLDRAELPALGTLTGVENETLADGLRSRYSLRLQARRAALVMAGRNFVIHGFGPGLKVVDFGNIAGHLLAGDLKELEQALAAVGRFGSGSQLLALTQRFVESELNLAIAERVSPAMPEAAAHKVQQALKGTVDADYVARAVLALRTAFHRLYGASLWRPLWLLAALGAVVSAGLFAYSGPVAMAWQIPLTVALGGMLLWFLPEWLARRRLKSAFPSAIAARVLGQLRASRSPWHWRGGAAVLLLLSSFVGLHASGQLPWVQRLHAERSATKLLDLALGTWLRSPIVDLKQRSYPNEAALRRAAQGGDARAATVLAWKHLLGAAGTPPDLDGASRWLSQAPARGGELGALQDIAHAALLVQRGNASAEQLQQAVLTLDGPVGSGGLEARYWAARIHLEAPAPLRQTALGLQKLTQAAHAGHGRAAFALGERYALGIDMQRDSARARRYLTQARSLGVAEADGPLKALR